MKLFSGLITLLAALLITATAAWFSVSGLVALFAATAIPVLCMGAVLEGSKIIAAGWLHANWQNSNVSVIHKAYLSMAVFALMIITSIGIYGFLSKGHLEQAAPVAGIELQINAKTQQIQMLQDNNTRLTTQMKQLDDSVNLYLQGGKASAGLAARNRQGTERKAIQKQMDDNNTQIEKLNADILPLKSQTLEVETKLGPVKYVAKLFGWKDTDSAVNLIIGVIMFAFDPLAVIMFISGTITIGEWSEERKARKLLEKEEADRVATEKAAQAKIDKLEFERSEKERLEREKLELEIASQKEEIEKQVAAAVAAQQPEPVVEEAPVEEQHVEAVVEPVVIEPLVTIDPVEDAVIRQQLSEMNAMIGKIAEPVVFVYDEEDPQAHDPQNPVMEIATTLPVVETVLEETPEEEVTEEIPVEVHEETPEESIHEDALADALHELAEEHDELKADEPAESKERLIEIFEKRPAFLQELIDVISDHIEENNTLEQAEEQEPVKAPNPNNNWLF